MSKKSRLVIIIIAFVVLIGGGVAALLYFGGVFSPRTAQNTIETVVPIEGDAYKESLREKESEIAKLVAAGGTQSIEQAEKIVNEQVRIAEQSQNKAFIVDAQLAKAALLNETDRPQDALKSLLELEKQNANNPEQLNIIYAQISFAYKQIGDLEKSNEYLAKIPGEGWDE